MKIVRSEQYFLYTSYEFRPNRRLPDMPGLSDMRMTSSSVLRMKLKPEGSKERLVQLPEFANVRGCPQPPERGFLISSGWTGVMAKKINHRGRGGQGDRMAWTALPPI